MINNGIDMTLAEVTASGCRILWLEEGGLYAEFPGSQRIDEQPFNCFLFTDRRSLAEAHGEDVESAIKRAVGFGFVTHVSGGAQ